MSNERFDLIVKSYVEGITSIDAARDILELFYSPKKDIDRVLRDAVGYAKKGETVFQKDYPLDKEMIRNHLDGWIQKRKKIGIASATPREKARHKV